MPSCFRLPPSRTAPQKLPMMLFLPATGKIKDLLIGETGGTLKENEITEIATNTATTGSLLIQVLNFAKERKCWLLAVAGIAKKFLISDVMKYE